MAGLIVSRPMKLVRCKEEVNGPRNLNDWSSKPMRIMRGKEEVNGPRKPRK